MNQFEKQENFFDKRTVFAIVIVMGIILGWQMYLSKKYPTPVATKTESKAAPSDTTAQSSATSNTEPSPGALAANSIELPSTESTVRFTGDKFSFDISNRGMGLKNINLHSYKERDGSEVVLGKNLTDAYVNETRLGSKPLLFNVQKISDLEYKGTSQSDGSVITKTYKINPTNYTIDTSVNIQTPKEPLLTYLSETLKEKSSSFLMPSFDHDTFFVLHEGSKERVHLDTATQVVFKDNATLSKVSIASLGGHYFTTIIKDRSSIAPDIKASTNIQTKNTTGTLVYNFSNQASVDLGYMIFIGPKDTTLLASIDEEFTQVIDYGIFSWIAKPILSLLKLFYSFFGNYGVAIILVTLIIRMILLPLNISSFRSMKKMQEIQPLLKAVKEKYKKNPQQLQIETMNIMKTNKVNPLGGCLPMLLQLPIFIALYNVLAQSIELYQAPFMLWIHDLSLKDPYYVLPVLMGITMYVQQKITPTTMDPAQAKAMQIMPVIFSLLMITLPSGLTLYIFISTLFGITQQYLFMNDKKQKQQQLAKA